MERKWTLHWGCHKGTMTSRDTASSETGHENSNPFLSLEDCKREALWLKKLYAVNGYYLWYAHAVDPDGNQYNDIVPGISYR